ncbi:hypothetical protein OPV22_024400 [Ensete ventricosum]|uniref:Uncharacterized protein n=1 Tax=Ensete ventricosum TaxID=4639 RepID=A0AAV8QET6_ENSVE|nr:hypothetical protein OPV22_024400 [Ensete ventricosum]
MDFLLSLMSPKMFLRFLVLARKPIIPRINRAFKSSTVFTLEEGPGVFIIQSTGSFFSEEDKIDKDREQAGLKRVALLGLLMTQAMIQPKVAAFASLADLCQHLVECRPQGPNTTILHSRASMDERNTPKCLIQPSGICNLPCWCVPFPSSTVHHQEIQTKTNSIVSPADCVCWLL